MRRPFQLSGRTAWFAEVEHKDGRRERRQFDRKAEASAWLHRMNAAIATEFEPALGGPTAVNLAQMLTEYARLYTINKHGWNSELTRINHYRLGGNLPPLTMEVDEAGHRTLIVPETKALPQGFAKHRDLRLSKRKRTYRAIEDLGATIVSRITPKSVQELVSTMRAEGLSESTIQKELALLKHAFNESIRTWSWSLMRNPCVGIKVGGSNRRFVVLTDDEQDRLVQALSECDNPQVWPMVELAIASMLRSGSLLQLRWDQVDLDSGITQVWTKGFVSQIPLSPRAVEILRELRSVRVHGSERVFTMTPNAVAMSWRGVREKAGLPRLQFRDLRHVGATFYARILNAHELRQALGHRTIAMAEVYVNIARNDVSRALAKAEQQLGAPRPMPRSRLPDGLRKLPRQRRGIADPATPGAAVGPTPPLALTPSPIGADAPGSAAVDDVVRPGRDDAARSGTGATVIEFPNRRKA